MLVSMAEDIRVVLIKLADRLHNMRTLEALPPEKRQRIAQETLDIYSPLAHRLGIWEIKWRLDDLAFRLPGRGHATGKSPRCWPPSGWTSEEAYVEKGRRPPSGRPWRSWSPFNVRGEVVGRGPRASTAPHRKMQKYATQGQGTAGHLRPVRAPRVLVDTKEDCYKVLGVVHQLWHPIPGQFDDYIATPKDNLCIRPCTQR